jgi:hypothetical protein
MESSMRRRNILAATLASAGALFSAARAQAAAPDATKVVYHLDDLDKVACLNTMRAQEVALQDLLPGLSSPTRAVWCASLNCSLRAICI